MFLNFSCLCHFHSQRKEIHPFFTKMSLVVLPLLMSYPLSINYFPICHLLLLGYLILINSIVFFILLFKFFCSTNHQNSFFRLLIPLLNFRILLLHRLKINTMKIINFHFQSLHLIHLQNLRLKHSIIFVNLLIIIVKIHFLEFKIPIYYLIIYFLVFNQLV